MHESAARAVSAFILTHVSSLIQDLTYITAFHFLIGLVYQRLRTF